MISVEELIGISPSIEAVRAQIRQLITQGMRAHQLPSILLQGETGTGKGLVARLIHREGPRRDGPFVDVNCSAIPDGLLESELFGFERGAFTDARQAKPGLLQQAHQGTLFLDEVGLLPESLQPKLLKAIEDRAVRRLGSTRLEKVDVHIIAASNEHLPSVVRARRFRGDLYHRIAVVNLTLPPLRERNKDILLLAEHFLSRICKMYCLAPPRQFSADARTALLAYSWPGNVRELSNVLESAALLGEQSTITSAALRIPSTCAPLAWSLFDDRISELEREQLVAVLTNTKWNVSRAAVQLGISRNRLRYRIEKHQLRRDGYQHAPATSAARIDGTVPCSALTSACTDLPAAQPWEGRHLALLKVDLPFPANDSMPAARALSVIANRIRSFGGSVEELGASTVVGAFGLEPIENAASNAASAALAIQTSADQREGADPGFPAVRIALHSGRLLVGRIDGRIQIHLDDKRETESILAELSAAAQYDRIIISKEAAPFLERRFQLERKARTAADGGWFYRLAGRERTGFGLAGRALTQFVGRQRELDAVISRLVEVERCRGQIVSIVGEPGVGKSRLIYELIGTDRVAGWLTLSCRAFSYGATTPSLPVIELLKDYFHIHDRDTSSEVQEKVSKKLLACFGDSDPRRPAILALLDLPIEDDKWRKLDSGQRRQRTFEAIKQILLQESLAQPLIVIFEDLHWIDTETQGLLDSLVGSLPAARLLLLVTYRPEYRHRWGAKTYYTQLHLSPLAVENAQAFLERLMGGDDSLQPIKRLLVERTDGNPLFLEESVRALAETGAIEGDRRAYRLSETAPKVHVSVTIEAILATRIARLLPEDKRLLQAAAAIGREIPYALLEAIWKGSEETLCEGLARLQEAELLYETTLPPNHEYTFKHALTHEVAYGSVLQERRKALHAQIMAAIERLYADRLAEQIERLAHHALRGEVWDKALGYSRQASEKALGRSASREAWSHLEQAIAVLPHLPQSRATLEQAVDLHLATRPCLAPLGEYARWLELARAAEPLAKVLEDPRREALVHCSVSMALSNMGRSGEGIEHGKRALAIAEALQEPTLRIIARHSVGLPHWFLGSYRIAIGFYQRDVGLEPEEIPARLLEPSGAGVFQEALTRFSYYMSQSVIALCCIELGEFDQAMLHAERAVKFAQLLDNLYLRAMAEALLGSVHLRKGDFQQALHLAQRCLQTYAAADLPFPQLVMAATLGEAFNVSGQLDDALALFDRAWQFADSKGILAYVQPVLALLGDAYGRAGRIDEAVTTGQRALELARELRQRGYEARTLYLLGNIYGHDAPANATQARDSYQQALVLAHELGMRPLEAHCHFALGELATKAGEKRAAQEQFGTALSMFREMGMQLPLEKAESALKDLLDAY
jgi:transcriptional regulator with AAA-type ATPase domain/predicted ATPase